MYTFCFSVSGLFQVLRQAVGQEEDLDFVTMLNEAKEGDEESEGFGKEFRQSAAKQITRPNQRSLVFCKAVTSSSDLKTALESAFALMRFGSDC